MNLKFEKEAGDLRGKILFFSYGEKRINLFELKKGFARGGHYHKFDVEYILISGKIEHREENIDTKRENIKIISVPTVLHISPNVVNLIIALEDTVFLEVFNKPYEASVYPKYRKIVEERMRNTS